MQRRLTVWAALSVLAAVAAAAGAPPRPRPPVTVSPGSAEEISRIADRCPTFSWGGVPGARGYELVVYQIHEDGSEARAVLREEVTGAGLLWTPALDRCLEGGRRYAWSVRAVGGRRLSEWSRLLLFEVVREPSESRLLAVLAAANRYSAGRLSAAETTGVLETGATQPLPAVGPTKPALPTAATVTGAPGLVAEGEVCCDGSQPGAYAARLSNTSLGSDPDVLALVSAKTDPGQNVNYIAFFDWDSSQNEPRLVGEIEGDGQGGLHFTGSARISGPTLEVGSTLACPPQTNCEADIYCSGTNQRILGGGPQFIGLQVTDRRVLESHPAASGSSSWWHAQIRNTGTVDSVSWRVYAVCAEVGL